MRALKLLKLRILLNLAKRKGYVSEIPDNMYNKLRYYYHDYIPASFYLLFKGIKGNTQGLKNMLLSIIIDEDFNIVEAHSKKFGRVVYIETKDKIYDPTCGMIANPSYYEHLFQIDKKRTYSKEVVRDYMDKAKIATDTIYDCQNVSIDLLEDFEQQKNVYTGKRKELRERQVDSFFKDILYENQVMYIDLDHDPSIIKK